MYKIRKEFHFSASHVLEGLPVTHPCSRLHGHNYIVVLEIVSPSLTAEGFVIDYRQLDFFKKFIDEMFDHRHLNDFLQFNPTAENIAEHLFVTFKDHPIFSQYYCTLQAVEVKETDKTSARYDRD